MRKMMFAYLALLLLQQFVANDEIYEEKEVIKDDMKKNEEEKNEKSLNIIFIPKFFILLDR